MKFSHKFFNLAALVLFPGFAFAAGEGMPSSMLYAMVAIALVMILFSIYSLMRANNALSKLGSVGDSGYANPSYAQHPTTGNDATVHAQGSGGQKGYKQVGGLMGKLTGAVDLGSEADIDLGHEFDGIRELDNKLPPWWVGLFWITIVFSIIYMGYYHIATDWSSDKEYEMQMAAAEKQVAAHIEKSGGTITEETVELLTDEASLAAGKEIYTTNCAACHLPDGGGSIGPNFTDKYWIHGGSINDVFKTVKYGVPEMGMISWKASLSPVQMQQVSSYILSLQGTTPAVAKDPQGELYEG